VVAQTRLLHGFDIVFGSEWFLGVQEALEF
jgi:hypothetical protein